MLGQRTAVFGDARGTVGKNAALHVDLDLAALQVATDEFLGKRILDIALNGAAQGARTIRAVFAGLLDDPVDHLGRQLQPDLPVHEVVVELIDEQPRDRPQIIIRQRLEHDDFVDTIDELGVEGLADLAEHHVVDAACDRSLVG